MYNTGPAPEKNYNNKIKTTIGPPLLCLKHPYKTPPLTNLRGGGGPDLLWIRACQCIFNKTPVLHTLLDVRKTCVNDRMLACVSRFMSYSCVKYTFNTHLKTHVLHILHIFLCNAQHKGNKHEHGTKGIWLCLP